MKTNKYGTPNQRITKIVIALLVIVIIALLNGASYKPLIYKIFNEYEEVCVQTQRGVGLSGIFSSIPDGECVEYQLRRRTDVKPFIDLNITYSQIGVSPPGYEEVCRKYKEEQVTQVKCCEWTTSDSKCHDMLNETHADVFEPFNCDNYVFWHIINKTWTNTTQICEEYHLIRLSNER